MNLDHLSVYFTSKTDGSQKKQPAGDISHQKHVRQGKQPAGETSSSAWSSFLFDLSPVVWKQ